MASKKKQQHELERRDTEESSAGLQFAGVERTIENITVNQHPANKSNIISEGNQSNYSAMRKSTMSQLFKVVLMGDTKVGKSSIVMRLTVRANL